MKKEKGPYFNEDKIKKCRSCGIQLKSSAATGTAKCASCVNKSIVNHYGEEQPVKSKLFMMM